MLLNQVVLTIDMAETCWACCPAKPSTRPDYEPFQKANLFCRFGLRTFPAVLTPQSFPLIVWYNQEQLHEYL